MNRIDERFDELGRQGGKALIPFIAAGDPSLETTEELVLEIEMGDVCRGAIHRALQDGGCHEWHPCKSFISSRTQYAWLTGIGCSSSKATSQPPSGIFLPNNFTWRE